MIDLTKEPIGYSIIAAPAGQILHLIEVSRAGWYLREEDVATLEGADPNDWYRVDLFMKPRAGRRK